MLMYVLRHLRNIVAVVVVCIFIVIIYNKSTIDSSLHEVAMLSNH